MDDIETILLESWRGAACHHGLQEILSRLFPALVGRLPLSVVAVQGLEPGGFVETLAWEGASDTERTGVRTSIAPADLARLLAWHGRGEILVDERRAVEAKSPGLVPGRVEGAILAAPLNPAEGSPAVLLMAASPPRRFTSADIDLAQALVEPLATALGNERRLRELMRLRELVETEPRTSRSRLAAEGSPELIVGAETGLREVMEQIELVSASDAPVLILGETGSGKEVVARSIHGRSPRASAPFLRVNCGAIPSELVDSELFGHEKGSFTGAVGERKGWFERADGGTLFLDECGELPPAAQVRLLRILQDGRFERVGGETSRRVDVRIVAATHRDLHAMVQDGRFRQDLWYRLAVFPIHLPPLRARLADLPALAAHFARRSAKRLGIPSLAPTLEDVGLLIQYPWPGNVRELAAVIERAAILGNGAGLDVARALGVPSNIDAGIRPVAMHAATATSFDERLLTLDEAAARHIEQALIRTAGRIEGVRGAAALLGLNPHTLRSRMRKLGLDWSRYRGAQT